MSVESLKQENTQLKATLLQHEQRLCTQAQQLCTRAQQLCAKEKRITQLEALIRGFQHKQFGASSEQSPHQTQLFDEAEQDQDQNTGDKGSDEECVIVPAHTRQK